MADDNTKDDNTKNDSGTTPPTSGAAPLKPEQQEVHREGVLASADRRAQDQGTRRDDMRMNMMRSVVTEPLLSRVQAALTQGRSDERFDVIISLNEMFAGGVRSAGLETWDRALKWEGRPVISTHYVFATLTADQILALAEETRQLMRDKGQNGAFVYRIWEDNDVNVSLT